MEREDKSEIIFLIKDMQKRMSYLEKKIDILIGRSTERSSSAKRYSQTSRTYGGPQRYNNTSKSHFGTKSTRTSRSVVRKRSNEDRGFPKENKTFNPSSKKRSDKS